MTLGHTASSAPDRQEEGRAGEWRHLVFDHGTEVVVPEEDRDLALFGRGVELAQTVIGQLGGRGLQELLCYQTCGAHTHTHTHTLSASARA